MTRRRLYISTCMYMIMIITHNTHSKLSNAWIPRLLDSLLVFWSCSSRKGFANACAPPTRAKRFTKFAKKYVDGKVLSCIYSILLNSILYCACAALYAALRTHAATRTQKYYYQGCTSTIIMRNPFRQRVTHDCASTHDSSVKGTSCSHDFLHSASLHSV